jgi:hypothetical protein
MEKIQQNPVGIVIDNNTLANLPDGSSQIIVQVPPFSTLSVGTELFDARPSAFNFDLLQQVKLALSGERGHVIGRAEYSNQSNQYFIRYVTAEGRQTESWWPADALEEDV